MEISEFVKQALSRPDLWGLLAASIVTIVGFYLKSKSGGRSPAPDRNDPSAKIETVAKRLDGFDKRLARVESDIEHLPTREEFHQMELGMVKLQERTVGIERTTESTGRAVGRIEDFMISMKRSG
jgi:hypothetical protein